MYSHIHSILTHAPTTPIHNHHTYSHTLTTGEFVLGRVIRAMSQCWHPKCFKCVSCHTELADVGFVKNQGRYCHSVSTVSYPSPISFQDYLASFQLGSFPDRAPNPFQQGSFPTCVSWFWVSMETENMRSRSHEHTYLIYWPRYTALPLYTLSVCPWREGKTDPLFPFTWPGTKLTSCYLGGSSQWFHTRIPCPHASLLLSWPNISLLTCLVISTKEPCAYVVTHCLATFSVYS